MEEDKSNVFHVHLHSSLSFELHFFDDYTKNEGADLIVLRCSL